MLDKRINYIDFLKFIGLTGIIIAHVGSPDWLMMLRNFDVPLMVIVSSILASYSIKKNREDKQSTINYYISRIKRLAFPTWIFLIMFFIYKTIIKETMSIDYYISSFLLTKYGLGYIWIILIFLYSALLIPLFRRMGYKKRSSIIILGFYILYEILYYYNIGTANKIRDTTFYYIIPYGLLTYLGFNIERISNKKKKIYILINFIVFSLFVYYYYIKTGTFQSVQIAKYPPRLYYLSYGIFSSLLILYICQRHNLNIFNNKIIIFISKHSLWIYLWHIFVLDIYKYTSLPEIWYVKLLFVYTTAIIITFIINKLLDLMEKNHKLYILKYLRG